MSQALTAWDSETELVRMILATGCVEGPDAQAQSLLLVSPWGQGKSAMLLRFQSVGTAKRLSDLTSFGMRRLIQNNGAPDTMRHWLLPELERLYARDFAVSMQAVNLMSNLMTGDAGVEMIGKQEFDFAGRQIGVIGAMTDDVFKNRKDEMAAGGLLSRFIVIHVDRDKAERERVLRNMIYDQLDDLRPVAPWTQRPRVVLYSPNDGVGEMLEAWLASDARLRVERPVARYKMLLRAIAWLRGDSVTTRHHVMILKQFAPFFLGAKNVQLGSCPSPERSNP